MEAESHYQEPEPIISEKALERKEEQRKKKKSKGIVFNKPTLSKKELKSVLECMVQDEISFGKVAANLEKEFANAFDFQKALSAPSLTSAYHLAFLSLGFEKEDEIIVSASAPVAILDAISYVGANAVLVDLDQNSFHPSIESIQSKISKKTKSIILNYPFGSFFDYEPLREYLQSGTLPKELRKQIKIIEDISYIAGIEHGGSYVGSHSDIAIIGLHSDMLMTTGKGAIILTDSRNIYGLARDLRMHNGNKPYRVRYDYTIPDYQAAMGIEQLSSLPQVIERRKAIGKKFLEAAQSSKYLDTYFKSTNLDAFGQFPIILKNSIENGMRYFNSLQIEIKRVNEVRPLHQLTGAGTTDFPNAEKLYQRGLLIPIYPYLTKANVERLIGALKGYY